jgi:hypothetical protein
MATHLELTGKGPEVYDDLIDLLNLLVLGMNPDFGISMDPNG